jgi:hypothetical protein
MHAVVIQVTIHDFESGRRMLEERIVPTVSKAPGFVAGYWTRSEDDRGLSMVVVESEGQARDLAEMIKSAPPDEGVTLDSIDVREVVAHA